MAPSDGGDLNEVKLKCGERERWGSEEKWVGLEQSVVFASYERKEMVVKFKLS